LKEYLSTDPKLIVLTHANPDGDAIGGALSLHFGLKGSGLKSSVACLDPVPKTFHFLAHTDEFLTDFDENAFDAVIFLDCGDKKMTRFHDAKPRILSNKMVKINIDHHPSNDNFGDMNFVVTHACSSSEIVFRLLQQLKLSITPQIATALLLGVYTDTGSFMHQNTTPQSYATAAELVRLGGNVSQIARNIFHSNEFRTFKLWGKVLNNLNLRSWKAELQ
jgi:phosphoesterase RecJ-like protein